MMGLKKSSTNEGRLNIYHVHFTTTPKHNMQH